MIIAFSVLFILGVFVPLFLWWLRNLSRIFSKKDIYFITDNLFRIFMIGFLVASIAGLFLGLAVANII